jgi:hypothetical protein
MFVAGVENQQRFMEMVLVRNAIQNSKLINYWIIFFLIKRNILE